MRVILWTLGIMYIAYFSPFKIPIPEYSILWLLGIGYAAWMDIRATGKERQIKGDGQRTKRVKGPQGK